MVVVWAILNPIMSPNDIVLLVTVYKFDPHPILVNVNKFKLNQLSAIF
jgi:hypothetical protein